MRLTVAGLGEQIQLSAVSGVPDSSSERILLVVVTQENVYQPGIQLLHPTFFTSACMRQNMASSADDSRRVLCVACSPKALEILDRALRYSQLRILTAATREKGVAICVAETIALAVLDAESIRGEEGSVAKSLKAVRPALPIIMLEERRRPSEAPDGVDGVVPVSDPERLLKAIQGLLSASGAESASAAS